MNKSFLFVLWAGGGNVPPQLVLARRMAARGHEVRVLAPAALRKAIESAGLAFEPYRDSPEHDESVRESSLVRDFEARTPIGAVSAVRKHLLAGMAQPIAADVLRIVGARHIDAIASDHTLVGGLFAAESAGVPSAMLVHTVYPFPGAGLPPFGMGWAPKSGPVGSARDAIGRWMFHRAYEAPLLPRLNDVRARLGLARIGSLEDLVARTDRVLVLTSPAFDFPGRVPVNVRYVGAQVEDPDWAPAWTPPWPADDTRPLVAVGLTTTFQGHGDLLRRTVAALAGLPVKAFVSTGSMDLGTMPANVFSAPWVPHERLLPLADVVVTHAGLGTVHAALTHGRPLVCLPIGRDQPDNAARVAARGAGVRLSHTASQAKIAAAVSAVIGDTRFAEGARQIAAAMARDDAATAGPDELVRLAEAGRATASAAGGRAASQARTAAR